MRSRLLALLAFAAYAGLFAALRLADPTLPPTRPLAYADLDWYFYPSLVFVHDSLRSGALPLWNPHPLAGSPFVALHQPGALYPPSWRSWSATAASRGRRAPRRERKPRAR
jgi:hypothetical protein